MNVGPAITVNRDVYARFDVKRRLTDEFPGGCAWCGRLRERHDKPLPLLFQYGSERDDRPGRIEWDPHGFCSWSCYRTYHDI